MIPFLVAALLLQNQGGAPALPTPSTTTLPTEVRDWAGFKYLPSGPRATPQAFATPGDWSKFRTEPAAEAAVWRMKVVILDRVDRAYDRGGDLVWPGHYGFAAPTIARIRRALPQLRALASHLSNGSVSLSFDIAEDPEMLSIHGGDLSDVVRRYLEPRINGGRYDAEDGVYRGPYQSVVVVHPVGEEPTQELEVQGTPVTVVGLPDVWNQEVDGGLAGWLANLWQRQVALRAHAAGMPIADAASIDPAAIASEIGWPAILAGRDASTEARLKSVATQAVTTQRLVQALGRGERGVDTTVKLTKDPVRGAVLTVEELGLIRSGGVALPLVAGHAIDVAATPTFAFWAKSEARDPIVLQFAPHAEGSLIDGGRTHVVRLGVDVPFAFDGQWHRVKLDLRPLAKVERILIAPDAKARVALKSTLGPIIASFADFEATNEAADAKPEAEAPSATATSPEARAAYAASAGPGDVRRTLMKDPSEAVRANAVAAALERPDPADEPLLIESALYTFEPTIFTPALRALGRVKTPTADEGLRRALRSAASDRARGLAAEILAESGDAKLVPQLIGLNQARSRAARISAVRALGKIPGGEAALMRMAFLPQDDPEIKLATTLTADVDDDYQGRKVLWSAVNEPSDAVRLESLRRLSYSKIAAFRSEGLKGVRDDSVGVRVGLLRAWAKASKPEFLPSIRLAMTDRSPVVRAAALDALAATGEAVELKDLPLDDPDPRVQLAILRLGKAKDIPLPVDTIARLRQSPDPAVRAAVG